MPRVNTVVNLHGVHTLFDGDIQRVVDLAVAADEIGIDYLSLPDHVVMGLGTDAYPYGKFPLPETFAWFEPLTVLAAIAGRTRRIRLSTSVVIVPLRPAALLAKICATLDQLSGGRFELGAGTGWQREEYEACGVPFENKAARMIDSLRACRALWSGERVSLDTATVQLDRVCSVPAPLQSGGVPLWLGMAPTPRARGWMAELEAGWIPMANQPEVLQPDIERISEAYEKAGRSASDVRVRSGLPVRLDQSKRPDLAATLEGIGAAAAVGVTDIEVFVRPFIGSPDAAEGVLRQIAAAA